ncbi:accessory Sec system S-layer assembly protein [Bacillaceae bacterium S4-13-58]
MFPFSKSKKVTKENTSGIDQSFDAKDLLEGPDSAEGPEEELVQTEISYHPDWKLPEEEKYVYAFHHSDLKPLKPNQLSLSGINMDKQAGGYVFVAFIRQTLSKDIQLKEMPILLLGPNQEKLARKVFDLSQAGVIPSKTSRPWQFAFQPKDFFTNEEIPREGWSLAFEIKPTSRRHELDLADSWKQSLAEDAIESLEKVIANAAPLKPGEVNFMGINARIQGSGDLAVTVLIRNGTDKNIQFQQLPLKVEDASGEVIAEGSFKFDSFEVKANTSKPWTFIFPKSMVKNDVINLSKWRVYPVQ